MTRRESIGILLSAPCAAAGYRRSGTATIAKLVTMIGAQRHGFGEVSSALDDIEARMAEMRELPPRIAIAIKDAYGGTHV